MKTFKNWFNEMATRHVFDLGDEIPNTGERDEIGLPRMARPGFRKIDKQLIIRDSAIVEKKLNAATEQYGIHWLIGYIAPSADMKELDSDWQRYKNVVEPKMSQELNNWAMENQATIPPPNPNNTIVYVKPTSRVHNINAHQQVHNIGHAIWGNNPSHINQAKEILKQLVQIQQNAHGDNTSEPTEAEITVMLGRILGLQMLARTLVVKPGDLDKPSKVAMTGFNGFDEVIFDLFTAFVNAKGKLKLYPRESCNIAPFDKRQAIPPNDEVIQKKGVRSWVWAELSPNICMQMSNYSAQITKVIVDALNNSVWTKKGAPIYPYEKLTTS